ncbi:MAG: EscE/YscE/SsaE family type III secretion system needle protein co-chaperone [Candidatus Competibacteraceae bacterium]|jgi:hypothetical protein|nr:EscE/YscE/SsaE family type III secretion system needle protein co-chaperone [Candidatus Competibacteraceae bacterium]
MMEQQPAYLDIELALQNDTNGVYQRQLVDEFRSNAQLIRQELNRGVNPTQYQRLDQLLKALDAASNAVEELGPRLRARG